MLFYFDFTTWRRLVWLAAHEGSPRRRFRLYFHLLVQLPLLTLFNALCFALDPLLFPGLRRTEVRQPVFVIGHARSGTTLMHRLLGADGERFSVFRYWELFAPSVLQKKAVRWLACIDAGWLGGRLERWVDAREKRIFGPSNHIHKMGYRLPEEDDFMLTNSCASGYWMTQLPYLDQLDFYYIDRRPAAQRQRLMGFYRECVRRQLYVNGGNRIHLSKNPTFCGRVETLLEVFPDARFVVLYRNPLKTMPSLLKLMKFSWSARHFDEARMLSSFRALAEMSFHNYTYPLEVLDRHPDTARAIVDYRRLVADPRGTVQDVYAALGMEIGPEFAAVLDAEQERAGRHETTHSYSLAEFGLDADEIRTRLAPLFERFGWDRDSAVSEADRGSA